MTVESAHAHWHFHFEIPRFKEWSADGWAGFAAMLVALPSAVAYGVAIYSVLGPQFAAQGALAGVVGAIVLGLIAPAVGGAPRLVSTPCAPAAAMMTGLAAQLASGSSGRVLQPHEILLLLSLVTLSAGLLQLLYGLAGGGQLIKYIPFPVISGYLSAVGLLVLLGQLPQLFGIAKGVSLWRGIVTPALWQWPSIIVGSATIIVFLAAPRITRTLPAPILGLLGGMTAYIGLTLLVPEMKNRDRMVIGSVGGSVSAVYGMFTSRWSSIGSLTFADAAAIFFLSALDLQRVE